jgi:hypothetical protein
MSTHVAFNQPTQLHAHEPYVKAELAAQFLNLSPKHVLRLARERASIPQSEPGNRKTSAQTISDFRTGCLDAFAADHSEARSWLALGQNPPTSLNLALKIT